MATLNGFNAENVEPNAGFDPIPAGKYPAIITESEMKPTKAGTGRYLELKFQIIDGQHAKRNLWARLNLENPNQDAVRIARGELSSICRAIGVMKPNDSVELHNIPLVINVRCKKDKETGEISNEIKGYERKGAASQPAQAATAAPPWARK